MLQATVEIDSFLVVAIHCNVAARRATIFLNLMGDTVPLKVSVVCHNLAGFATGIRSFRSMVRSFQSIVRCSTHAFN